MRIAHLLALSSGLVVVCGAAAADPVAPSAPLAPIVMTASATACGPAIMLHVRMVQFKPMTVDVRERLPVMEPAVVGGKIVERVRYVDERRMETVVRAMPGAIMDVPLDGVEVRVVDLNGKPVPDSRIKLALKKETPVLVSFNGPVDPYYLQTTKPGTLIVHMPADRLSAPGEPLPAPRVAPDEPPLAPTKPAGPRIEPGEPPLAPTKPAGPRIEPGEPPLAPTKLIGPRIDPDEPPLATKR